MKPFVSGALEVVGIAAVAVGLWMLAPWLGVTIGGIGLVVLGLAVDPPKRVDVRRED